MAVDTPAQIAVLGAGPIGLEAALYARYLGYGVEIYERGRVAEHVQQWGHVRMFTPFGANSSPLGLAALKAQDPAWQAPAADALLTGHEFAARYLQPLAASDLLVDGLHEHCEVLAVGREDLLKGELPDDEARVDQDFVLRLRSTRADDHAREHFARADVVIDTTGTLANPNWLGRGGIAALGEPAARPHIDYGLPDVLGAERRQFASRNILLVGDGDSAATNLVALAELAGQAPDTWITWITRREVDAQDPQPVRVLEDDPLAERAPLARAANRLAASDANHVTLLSGTTVESVDWHPDLERFSVRLAGKHAGPLEFDRIIANVGYRPDTRIFEELHVELCPFSGRTRGLVQPEPDFYILGAKSHGRDSGFSISTGLEQIRELFAIIGDRADLNLYASIVRLA